jgi:hypothetical protein
LLQHEHSSTLGILPGPAEAGRSVIRLKPDSTWSPPLGGL